MSNSICGAKCGECRLKETCGGCAATNGCPFGKQCFIAKYISIGGIEKFNEFKKKLIGEFNALDIPGMPKLEALYALVGNFVNLEYALPNGDKIRFLDDSSIYLGNQLNCEYGEGRCYGIVAGMNFLLVCEYGEDGGNPELVLFKRR